MRAIANFFREVRAEFKNISWPKKDTLIQLSVVVISISVIISVVLGGFDYIFTQGLNYIGRQPQTNQIKNNAFPPEGLESVPTATSSSIPTQPVKK